jgi:hypothetical protein
VLWKIVFLERMFAMITFDSFVDYLRDEQGLSDKEVALFMYCVDDEYGGLYEALSEHGYDEGDRSTEREAMDNLFDNFGISNSYGDYYECDSMEFLVFDDYDEAESAARQYVINVIDDIGFTDILGWEDYVDEDWFEDAMRESYESYAEDIASEDSDKFESRLVEECYDRGLIDDDDFYERDGEIDYTDCFRYDQYALQEMLADDLVSDELIDGYASKWYVDNFGEESFNEVCVENNLIDEDEIADYVVRSDGVAHSLAGYDGQEHTYDLDGVTYFIYRNN